MALSSALKGRSQRKHAISDSLKDNKLIVPNGAMNNRSRLRKLSSNNDKGEKHSDISNLSKRRKVKHEQNGTPKTVSVARENANLPTSPTTSVHDETDVPEEDSPTFDIPYINEENSLDEATEESFEESESKFDKNDNDDIDRSDD